MFPPTSTLPKVKTQLAAMRTLAGAPQAELAACVESVSAWSPAQHLDHLAKVTIAMFRRLAASEGPPVPRPLTALGRALLLLGWIPRGKGRAPERFHGTKIDGAALLAAIDELETLTNQLDPVALGKSKERMIPHPRFGGLTPAQTLRFVVMHNDHHFKIIADVVRAARQAQSR